ncbi:MAG: hypothetical protein ACI4UX_02795 [Clostridia bacterium]
MLILVGVTINVAINGGLFKSTRKASEGTVVAKEKEIVNLAAIAAKGRNNWKELTEENLEQELNNSIGERNRDYTLKKEKNNIYVVTYAETGHSYAIKDDGSVQEKGKWEYKEDENGRQTIITNGKIELKIGDYINNYDPVTGATKTYYKSEKSKNGHGDQEFYLTGNEKVSYDTSTYKWRVLGVSGAGEIEIISEDLVQPTSGGYTNNEKNYYYLKSEEGCANGVDELNKICGLYGQGYGAIGARSVTIEDINGVTGYNPNNVGVYDPNQTVTGKKFSEDNLDEYGNQVTYYWDPSHITQPYCVATNGIEGNFGWGHVRFSWYDVETKTVKESARPKGITEKQKITTLTSTYCWYYATTLTTSTTGENTGLKESSEEYDLLFVDENGEKNYWLGSVLVMTGVNSAGYGIHSVDNRRVSARRDVSCI